MESFTDSHPQSYWLRTVTWFVGLASLVAVLTNGSSFARTAQAQTTSPIVWTELGPGSALIARVITKDASCPAIKLGTNEQAMQMRAAPAPPDFPNLTCEATIPADAASAEIAGQPLPMLKPNPQRIVVIGDTGCRIEGKQAQACNDPAAWPFAQIAQQAAAFKPDLVIHVGDYIYREDACPAGNSGCARSPYGDNWAALNADLFAPAAELLRAAPWVFVRGNHEDCNRGGPVWFRYLDPRPVPANCPDYTDPYAIPLGSVNLIVFDASVSNDFQAQPDQVAAYKPQFDAVRTLATGNDWLVSHKVLYNFGHEKVENGVEKLFIDQPTLQAASEDSLPASVELVVGGHIHLFEALSFPAGSGRPPQMIVGNSGTTLDPTITTPLTGLDIVNLKVASGATLDQFGFAVFERRGPGWSVAIRGTDGKSLTNCALGNQSLICSNALLPETGGEGTTFDSWLLVAVGWLLTAGGLVLRLKARG